MAVLVNGLVLFGFSGIFTLMPTNYRFCVLAIPSFQYFPKLTRKYSLGAGISLCPGSLTQTLESQSIQHWEKWLGTIEWDSIKTRPAFLLSKERVNSSVNLRQMQRRMYDAYLALIATAPLRTQGGTVYCISGEGTFQAGLLKATQVSEVSKYGTLLESHYMYSPGYHGAKVRRLFSSRLLGRWKKIFGQLIEFQKRKNGKQTVLLALESLKNGLHAGFLDFRLPYFTRVTEAIVAPRIGNTKGQFVSRSKKLLGSPNSLLFCSKSTDLDARLGDIFDIRNGCVHGMPFGWKLGPKRKSKRRLEQCAYLAEEAARRAIRMALSNRGFLSASGNRAKLEDWCDANL